MDDSQQIRLSKLLSERGICSRRKADQWIQKGYIKVDHQVITTLGTKVSREARIEISPLARKELNEQVTFILNKPLGWVSGTPEDGHPTAMKLLKPENQDPHFKTQSPFPKNLKNLAPAGRLDINSTGLIIYTQDGLLAKKIIQSETHIEKEYLVRVKGKLSHESLKLLNKGLSLDNKKLKPAKVQWINKDQLQFVLKEGKKRQVRRMCDLVGLEVLALKRVRIGPIRLGTLRSGKWRFITQSELTALKDS